ncbi:MAG: sulfur reduction protein DsrE [Actinobacteria bacterium HGW-Actinobacteria-6]|nr:MAG: sulfur reduction protein DsrE [Actinobacteria bacterium HGW-Actinobacteria-6]
MPKAIGFVVTHAQDDPEMATLPLMLAIGGMTMDVEPAIVLQGEGVRLAVKGFAETVNAEGLSPLEGLLSAILGAGHKIMVCSPCMETRGIVESDLREGFFIGGAAKVVETMLRCDSFVRY